MLYVTIKIVLLKFIYCFLYDKVFLTCELCKKIIAKWYYDDPISVFKRVSEPSSSYMRRRVRRAEDYPWVHRIKSIFKYYLFWRVYFF